VLVQHLERTRDAFVTASDGLSDAQYRFAPASDGWSIAQIVEHVALVELRILEVIGRLPQAPAPSDGKARGAGRIESIDYIAEVATGRIVLITSSAAVRRDVLEKTGGFGSFPNGQDSELWVRIASLWPVAISTRVTAAYRQQAGGISDRKRRDAFGRPPRSLAELSPAAARPLALRADAPEPRRRVYDAYVDRYLHWRLRAAISDRDFVTIREIRHLYERRPSAVDLALLWIGRLPGPLALFLYRAGRFS